MLARDYIARKQREFIKKHPEMFDQPTLEERERNVRARELAVQEKENALYKRELAVWYRDQVIRWEYRKRQAESEGREFTEPPPEPPPGIHDSGHNP